MDTAMLIEIFGYIGSALVVISMLMSSVVKLRLINVVGSIISGTYAIIVGALPLVLMNACLIVINVINLYKLLKTEQKYDLVDGKVDDASVHYFLERYKGDIQTFFPEFEMDKAQLDRVYMIYCEGAPAGLLLGSYKGDGKVDVVLDYTTPAYRDCTAASFLYSKLPARGITALEFSQKESQAHAEFLAKMGFVKKNNTFVKELS